MSDKPDTAFIRTRLSFNMFALFLGGGVHLPFLPLWFEGRGLSPDDIGIIFALTLWLKAPVGMLFTSIADASGERKRLQIIAAVIVLFGFIIMAQLQGFWPLLVAWAIVGTIFTTAIPLADSSIVTAVRKLHIDYGRVRLWGSISFIAVSTIGGWYLADKDSEQVIFLLIGGSAVMIITALISPNLKEAARTTRRIASLDLIKRPGFILFLLTAGALQSSHAALYGFSSLAWARAGLDDGTIGLLWAEGVVFEIILFTFSAHLLRRVSVPQIFLIVALAGMVRWAVLGYTDWLPALIVSQSLHAITFAATHLAAITYITKSIPNDQSASAQGLYDGIAMGFLFGVTMLISGWLFNDYGKLAFYAMIVFSALGGIGALVMMRRDNNQPNPI
jgi:PPP family 3-phenylpropionic acid transporter